MTSDIRKQAELIKVVFGGEKGKELLDDWKSEYRTTLLSTDREQNVLIGQQLFIENIDYLLNASTEDLKRMEEAASYDYPSDS